MKVHNLKIAPTYFQDVVSGKKKFEVRENDRGYNIGDYLCLREYDTEYHLYTGKELVVKIIYILGDFVGLKENYVVLGLSSPICTSMDAESKILLLDDSWMYIKIQTSLFGTTSITWNSDSIIVFNHYKVNSLESDKLECDTYRINTTKYSGWFQKNKGNLPTGEMNAYSFMKEFLLGDKRQAENVSEGCIFNWYGVDASGKSFIRRLKKKREINV